MAARILICRSNPINPDPRVEKIARTLTACDYQVSILGWDRSAELPLQTSLTPDEPQTTVFRLPVKSEYGQGLANLPNLFRWQWGLMRWLGRHHREYDVIHACDFDTVLPALVCKKLWGNKVVYDIFDFYADHLRNTPASLKHIIRRVDIRAINHADALILADDSRRAQIENADPNYVTVIYNSPTEPQGFKNTHHPPTRSEYTLRLAYVGLLQVERGLLEMLAVLSDKPQWSLELAGYGGDEEQILTIANKMPNVTWYGRIPYEKSLRLSQSADVLFATYDPVIPNHRYSSPNKLFEAMMLGKPIIVARHTNMDRIVEEADCGVVVPYGDIPALQDAVNLLQDNHELRQHLGKNARRAYETTYSWSEMASRLETLYNQVTGTPA